VSKTKRSAKADGPTRVGIGPSDPRERGQRRFLEDAEEDHELDMALAFLSAADVRNAKDAARNTAESWRVWLRDAYRNWKVAQKTGVSLLGVSDGDLEVDSEAPTIAMSGTKSEPPKAPKPAKKKAR
jgi:hypothetical protein